MKLHSFLTTVFLFATSFKANVDAHTHGHNGYRGKAFLGQIWKLKDGASYYTADVINTFLREFSPDNDKMRGFKEYAGSIVDNEQTLFIDVFDTVKQATAAQTAAETFYEDSALYDQIDPDLVVLGTYYYDYVADTSVSSAGRYYSLRYYEINDGATVSAEDTLKYFQENLAPEVQTYDGFQQYAGILLNDDPNHVVFYNVFDTREQADDANTKIKDFVDNSALADQITRLDAVTSAVMFDLKNE